MNTIQDDKFSFDYGRYVYQDPNVRIVERTPPTKPFELKSPEKPKKPKKEKKKGDK